MTTRRQFLRTAGGACGGLIALGQGMPRWWQMAAVAAEAANSARRLVVIELQGGNDGLNTVIPYTDDAYYRARPRLAIAAKEVIQLDDTLGLHPAMKSWQPLWDAGRLAIVENVGYPEPNRSHFESMDIWHAGQPRPDTVSGWLGRAADDVAAGELCYVGEGAIPRALSRRQRTVAALEQLSDLRLRQDAAGFAGIDDRDELAAVVAARMEQVRELSNRLPTDTPDVEPTPERRRPLAERMNVIRTLIEQDQPFRVFYTALDGFDTHSTQAGTHRALWQQTSEAVSTFLADLEKQKLAEGVAVFLFSEFGRRVHENGSAGTDHGAAAPVFIVGDGVRSGIQGGVPDLGDLDHGDLRYRVDFRDVYAGLLRDWLAVDPTPVLGQRDASLSLFG